MFAATQAMGHPKGVLCRDLGLQEGLCEIVAASRQLEGLHGALAVLAACAALSKDLESMTRGYLH